MIRGVALKMKSSTSLILKLIKYVINTDPESNTYKFAYHSITTVEFYYKNINLIAKNNNFFSKNSFKFNIFITQSTY